MSDPTSAPDADLVFKALADPTRRKLLDLLEERDGQTLTALCGHLDMTRQAVTQHLGVLEAAHLVVVIRRGRERLHHLNPVPLQELHDRWIRRFERPRLKALQDLKAREAYAPCSRALLLTRAMGRGQAAADSRDRSESRTERSLETPGSSIVTP